MDVVAAALLAEAPEVAEVLADLRVRDVEPQPQLLRTDDVATLRLQLPERAGVLGQAVDYPFGNIHSAIYGRLLI